MNQTPIIDNACRPLGAVAASNPDQAQTIEECTGDHGLNKMIDECMTASARQLAATEARHRGVQE